MKKILIILSLLMVSAIGLYAQDARAIYNKYSDQKGVSAVYVSSAMFRMIGAIPDLEIDGKSGDKVNLSPLVKSLSGFYMLSTEDHDIAKKIAAESERYIRSGKFELMMEAKEDGEAVRIYTVSDKDIVSSLIMTAKEESETTFICLDGAMNKKDLEALIAKASK